MAGRILIIDPVPTNRMVLKAKLALAHYEVSVADSVRQAGDQVTRHAFDAILISTALIDNTRNCVLKWMKSTRATQAATATIIFMQDMAAAAESPKTLNACLLAGADDVLSRPFAEDVLLSRIRNLMREKAHNQELQLPNTDHNPPDEEADQRQSIPTRIVMSCVASNATNALAKRLKSRLDDLNGHMRKTDKVTHVALSILTQPDGIPSEPDIVLLIAENGAADRALSIMSQMRSRARLHDVRIVLILETPDPAHVARAFDLGAHDVAGLDVNAVDLAARIKKQARIHERVYRMRRVVRESLVQAVTDPLTGLYNRRYAANRLLKMQRECLHSGDSFAILAFDVDHFKEVNDRFGHAVGDTVLTTLATTLRRNLRDGDLICRTGGEEFLVALPHTDKAKASATANRLRKAVGALDIKVKDAPAPLRVTVSVGLSIQDGHMPIPEMLEQADRALYQAKARGRNVIAIVAAA